MLNKLLFLLIISCSLGFAHSLKVFAKASGDTLEIKSYYYGGSACKGCDVELRDENGAFASSKLDEQGMASMELPNKASFKIAVIAMGGHMKESEFNNPNFLLQNTQGKESALVSQSSQNSQDAQNEQNFSVAQSQNLLNSQDENSSVFLEFLKGFGSILLIFAIFGAIYFTKKKR